MKQGRTPRATSTHHMRMSHHRAQNAPLSLSSAACDTSHGITNKIEFPSFAEDAKPYGGCRSPCHVVYTDYRPTPLQHFMYPAGADGLFLVVDERGVFREDSFQKAVASLTDQDSSGGAALQHPAVQNRVDDG